jgi:hypothetical protein
MEIGRNVDIHVWKRVVGHQRRLQEKCCASQLDVSVCFLTTLSIADISELG